MKSLEERLAKLEHRAEINDLVVRYFLAADDDETDAFDAIFSADARFLVSDFLCGDGREAVKSFLADERKKMGITIHTPHYAQITFRDDATAQGLVGAHLELNTGGTMVFGAVRYSDDYIRQNNGWRIKKRVMRTVYIAPWQDVGKAFSSTHPIRWTGMEPQPTEFPRKSEHYSPNSM